jgi:starch synthase
MGAWKLQSVWHVGREYEGIAEAGGLKDVVRGLAEASLSHGIAATAILPYYGLVTLPAPATEISRLRVRVCDEQQRPVVHDVVVRETRLRGVRILLLDAPIFRSKRGVYVYTDEDQDENPARTGGTGHADAQQMNLVLQHAALALARLERPALIHCHDGHAGFLPAMARRLPRFRRRMSDTGFVLTIHNAGPGYRQEVTGLRYAHLLTHLGRRALSDGVLGDAIEPMLVGGAHAAVNTVSPAYAQEIMRQELGLAYEMAGVEVTGITNGIDPDGYDPRRPEKSGLPFAFDPEREELGGKALTKLDLLARIVRGRTGRARRHGTVSHATEVPLVTYVGRLTGQKGISHLCAALAELFAERKGFAVVVLGDGEKELEEKLAALAVSPDARGRMVFLNGYDAELAKLIYASGDFLVLPSEYEPCGLSDLYGQMLGNVPLVRLVGGLVKVEDGVTGLGYQQPDGLAPALRRALDLWAMDQPLLARMRRMAFKRVLASYTWPKVFEAGYLPLYERVT